MPPLAPKMYTPFGCLSQAVRTLQRGLVHMTELIQEKEKPEEKSVDSDSTEEPTKESATSSTADAPSDEEPNSAG